MTLREQLDWMADARSMAEYQERLDRITLVFPNAPCVLEEVDSDANSSCFAYALLLAGNPLYEQIKDLNHNHAWACSLFADWLLQHDILKEVSASQATSGDLVWYKSAERFKHIGVLVEPGRVRSKFGKGHLFEHDLWAVPESYGSDLWYSQSVSAEQALESFLQYAEARGIEFELETEEE